MLRYEYHASIRDIDSAETLDEKLVLVTVLAEHLRADGFLTRHAIDGPALSGETGVAKDSTEHPLSGTKCTNLDSTSYYRAHHGEFYMCGREGKLMAAELQDVRDYAQARHSAETQEPRIPYGPRWGFSLR